MGSGGAAATSADLDAVRRLIELINSRPALAADEASRRYRAYHRGVYDKIRSTGLSYIEASGAPGTAINTTDEADFRRHVKKIDNDLAEQVRIVTEGMEHYFEHGQRPAPYYAWRIAIILRKAKQYQLETDLLEAFSHKFGAALGGRHARIAARVGKARALAAKKSTVE